MKQRQWVIYPLLLAAAAAGSILVAFSTRVGPGVGGDSTVYIAAARNLLSGEGLGWVEPDGAFHLLADFPPGYPLLLASAGLLGFDLIPAARWINVLLFAALIYLVGYSIFRATRSAMFSVLAAGLVALSPVLLPVYSWAMSEPLFLLLGFLALILLWDYVSQRSWVWLILSAMFAGLAFLTRYSGIAFLAAGAAALLFWNKRRLSRRLRDGLIYVLISSFPMLLWFAIDYAYTGLIASRRYGTGQSMAEMISGFWDSFSNALLFWIMPDSWVVNQRLPQLINQIIPPFILLVLVGWSVLVYIKAKQQGERQEKDLMRFLGLFMIIYLLVIVVTRFSVFPIVAINNRMLSPFYVAALLQAVLLGEASARYWFSGSWKRWALPLLFGLALLWYGWISAHVANQLSKDGLGFSSRRWQRSELIAAVKLLPEDVLIVTNEPKAILLLTDRAPYSFEEIFSREPLENFTVYGEGPLSGDEAQQAFRHQGAALVLFNSVEQQMQRLYRDQTGERLGVLTGDLYRYFQGSDGSIYFYEKPR